MKAPKKHKKTEYSNQEEPIVSYFCDPSQLDEKGSSELFAALVLVPDTLFTGQE